jgi:predicted dehydrogenase
VRDEIRWGILGLGSIAEKFATGLQVVPDAKLVAVGSRTQSKANQFGQQFSAPNTHGSYESLAADPDIDIVYIATPHNLHYENSLLCLQAGKAVLCEKPFTINAQQAEEVIEVAKDRKLFLMEAMWTRFTPIMQRLRELLAEGIVGEVRMLQADFGFRADIDPNSRLFNLELAGGALLDVGIYPISLSSMIFGAPSQIAGLAHFGSTGVDEQCGMVLGFSSGALAMLSAAVRMSTPHEATIMGTEGSIRIQSPWWNPSSMTISRNGKDEMISLPPGGNGYQYEAMEAHRCLRSGARGSLIMPLAETLQIQTTMDTLRSQWGFKYPSEIA